MKRFVLLLAVMALAMAAVAPTVAHAEVNWGITIAGVEGSHDPAGTTGDGVMNAQVRDTSSGDGVCARLQYWDGRMWATGITNCWSDWQTWAGYDRHFLEAEEIAVRVCAVTCSSAINVRT